MQNQYITVPGRTLCNGVVVPEFEVMAYPAAMGEAGVPVSVPDLKPWVNVSYYRAKEVSEKAGLGLLRESQAIALIHDIIEQDKSAARRESRHQRSNSFRVTNRRDGTHRKSRRPGAGHRASA